MGYSPARGEDQQRKIEPPPPNLPLAIEGAVGGGVKCKVHGLNRYQSLLPKSPHSDGYY